MHLAYNYITNAQACYFFMAIHNNYFLSRQAIYEDEATIRNPPNHNV